MLIIKININFIKKYEENILYSDHFYPKSGCSSLHCIFHKIKNNKVI